MFNRGISELLEALPEFEGLDGSSVKRLLTSAYLESLDIASLSGDDRPAALEARLRRLVTALEVHAVLVPDVDEYTRRACAFVAAESLNLLGDVADPDLYAEPEPYFVGFGSRERYRRVESALLYLIAAFDANAVSALGQMDELEWPEGFATQQEEVACRWAFGQVIRFIRLSSPDEEEPTVDLDEMSSAELLTSRLRTSLWQRVGKICRDHLRWLRLEDPGPSSGAVDALVELSNLLEDRHGGAYADIAHLVRLLGLACGGTAARALRSVPPPADDPSAFSAYQHRRCREKPLLWPSAERYRERCLPGPASHAAVSMPTGSGKSGVAELAVAQALSNGWVVYLAPTRALVRQVRRDLRRALGADVEVREFLGGSEFTSLSDDSLAGNPGRSVLVMTPEKCSLALRQSPEAFSGLALCVFDECHLIGEPGNRGVLAELVVAQMLQLAPDVKVVMQSALMKNTEEVAAWLRQATGHPCESIHEPWRPTRTLRGVAGFDEAGAKRAEEAAAQKLSRQPRKVQLKFEAPMNLLVSLQGAWSNDDPSDYALARTSLSAPLWVRRTEGGFTLNTEGYVNEATGSVARGLAEAGHRVLAFIPANKHYSFSVAKKVPGFREQQVPEGSTWETIEHLLDLSDFELGVPTVLRDLLGKGVAVHTSAMLFEERRASELAYDSGIARIVFATGTLAQGLNLPATAVVIGGINIGYNPDLTAAQRQAREQAQLLNAVGRAGRPYVAARSLAVVLPNQALALRPEDSAQVVRSTAAPFLEREDAAFAIRSQLGPLVDEALTGELTVDGIGVEGLTAFAFLPLRSDVDEAVGILGRTFAAARRPEVAEEQIRTVARAMVQLGERVLEEQDAPEWLIEVAYESGLSLRQIVAMWVSVRKLDQAELGDSISGWAALLVDILRGLPHDIVGEMLSLDALNGSMMRDLVDEAAASRHASAWDVFANFVQGWLVGIPLTDLAAVAVKEDASGKDGRGNGNPIPKIIGLTEQIVVFALTRVAGGLSVLIHSAIERESNLPWELSAEAAYALDQLSMGLRAGCGTPGSLAWWRFGGVRHRRVAHLIARLLPPPVDVLSGEDTAREWVGGVREQIFEPHAFLEADSSVISEDERRALVAFALLGER